MDKITPVSPKRLIVADAVDDLARQLFGDKYDYDMAVSQYDPLEYIESMDKPKWVTILQDESSEVYDMRGKTGTLRNEVLINVCLTAKVPSRHLSHAMPYLEDIETIKNELIGSIIDHKGHAIYGDVQSEDRPAFATTHDVEYLAGDSVFRAIFAIVLRIDDDRD